MARLRRADCSGPGFRRVKRGRGFSYLDEDGDPIDEPEVVERLRGLGIPPAWKDVWICPWATGHIQATGVDVAGRKQYLYHEDWRTRRAAEKFDEMLDFARDLPAYLAAINGKTFWEQVGGRWMGHDIGNANAFRASSLFQRFEGEALVAVADHEPFGADEITDLLLVNVKGPDYVAHAYGPDAPETKEEMAELDRQVTRLLEVLERKAGPGGLLLAITADHGTPGEPADGTRHYVDEIRDRIHARFDPAEKRLVTYYGDAANNQIYVDLDRLRTLGVTLADVASMLAAEPYLHAVYTEDEVRAAHARLPPR